MCAPRFLKTNTMVTSAGHAPGHAAGHTSGHVRTRIRTRSRTRARTHTRTLGDGIIPHEEYICKRVYLTESPSPMRAQVCTEALVTSRTPWGRWFQSSPDPQKTKTGEHEQDQASSIRHNTQQEVWKTQETLGGERLRKAESEVECVWKYARNVIYHSWKRDECLPVAYLGCWENRGPSGTTKQADLLL